MEVFPSQETVVNPLATMRPRVQCGRSIQHALAVKKWLANSRANVFFRTVQILPGHCIIRSVSIGVENASKVAL